MAFRASLELNNKEFDVLYSNYEFSRVSYYSWGFNNSRE